MRMKIFFWFCLLGIIVLFALPFKVMALKIVYPADGSYVVKSNYLIIKGGQDPYLDGMTVEINGVKSDLIDLTSEAYREAFADMLIVEPLFDPGENRVTIEGYLNGERFAATEVTVFYHADQQQEPPADFHKEAFHLVEREEPCADCHVMQAGQVPASGTGLSPCAGCHARMLSKPHVHGPAGVFECLDCHQKDSRPVKYQARNGDAQLCGECHEEKLQGFAGNKFVHGPIEAGLCLVCHDAHASEQPGQLSAKVNDLCLSCHASVKGRQHVASGTSDRSHPLEGPVNPLNDRKPFNCASCHDPHGGKSKTYFVQEVTGRMQLCSLCHKK